MRDWRGIKTFLKTGLRENDKNFRLLSCDRVITDRVAGGYTWGGHGQPGLIVTSPRCVYNATYYHRGRGETVKLCYIGVVVVVVVVIVVVANTRGERITQPP